MKLLPTFFILFFFISLAFCFTQTDYWLKDLERTTETKFITEADSWYSSVTDASSVNYYDCDGTFLLGSYGWVTSGSQSGNYFSRAYTDLPTHTTIVYKFSTWAIGSWDPAPDLFQIQFDSLTAISGYQLHTLYTSQALCGSPGSNDLPNTQLFGYIAHTSSSLTLKFISMLDELPLTESFGIRDIQLIFINKNIGSDYICAYQSESVPLYNFVICTCAPGQYSTTGTSSGCTDCDSSCASCYATGPEGCYECAEGYYFDGTSCSPCDSSCSYCTGPDDDECTSCPSGYLLFNGVCIDEDRCVSPFVLDDDPEGCVSPCSLATFGTWSESCFPPCLLTNEILLSNGACTTCTSLQINLQKETNNGYQYSMKLYPDSCDLDLDLVQKYLTITGSVGSFTFTVTKTAANTYLINLALIQSILKSTYLDVELSYLKGTMDVPKKFISDETLEAIASAASTISNVLNGVLGISFVATLALGATSSLWSIVNFQQFVGYFIYINVEYPQSIVVFLKLLQTSFWDYLPNPLSSLLEAISEKITQEGEDLAPYYNPPQKFVDNEITSFFIENGGTEISFNLYSIMLLLLIVLLVKRIKSLNKKPLLIKVKVLLRWNFIMRTFLEGGIPLCLSIFLQLRVASFKKAYLTVATSLAILSAIYVITMFLFICIKLYYRDNQHLDKENVRLMYETLYEGVNISKPYSKCYYMIILIRGILLACLVTFLESFPVFQITPLILFNVGLIYYMLKQVTFTNKKLDFIFKLKEVFILVGECCMLCLCAEINSQGYYKVLGYMTVFFLATPLVIEVIYMMILQIYEFPKIYRKIKEIVLKTYKTIFGPRRNQRRVVTQITPERTLNFCPSSHTHLVIVKPFEIELRTRMNSPLQNLMTAHMNFRSGQAKLIEKLNLSELGVIPRKVKLSLYKAIAQRIDLHLIKRFFVTKFLGKISVGQDDEYFIYRVKREVKSWSSSVTTLPTSKYYNCEGTYLLGGYDWKPTGSQLNEFFSRQYTDLPPHKTIIYSFTTWNLGSWDLSGHPIGNEPDRIQFQFDNLPVIEGYRDPVWNGIEIRGGNKIFGWIAHTSSSLLLKFISQLDEESLNEAFGIRDLKLIFLDKALGADYQCAIAGDGLPFDSQVMCSCSSGQYQSAATSECISCDSACASCYASGANSCYECAKDFYFDGTTCTACDSSCSDCTGSGARDCISCSSGYALFNGVCIEETSETIETISNVFNGFLGVSFVGTLALGATSSLWSIINFQQFVGYFIYINIEYPKSTKVFLKLLQTSFWDYLPNPLSSLLNSISKKITQEGKELAPHYNPPMKFIDNEVTSFFIENGGTEISFNLYSLLLLLMLVLLLKRIKSLNKKPLLIKVKVLLRWNFIMRTFIEGGIPLCLSIFLQFRIASFKKAYLTVATTLAILSAIYMIIMFLFICTKLYYRDDQHLDKEHVRLMYETLYEGVNLSKPYSKCYYLVILVRGCLLTCLIAFLEFSPILQTVPLILFNVWLIYYMLKQVTFTNKKLDSIFKLKEVFILIGECCILSLCFEVSSQNYYQVMGYMTVFFLATPLIIEVTYMFILQIYEIKKIYLKIKEVVSKIYKAIFGNGGDQRRITTQITPERTLVTSPTRRVKIRRNDPSFAIPSENSEMNIITDFR